MREATVLAAVPAKKGGMSEIAVRDSVIHKNY